MSSVRCKIRHILADYNADRKDLFSAQAGWAYIKGIPLSDADAFVIKPRWTEWEEHQARLLKLTGKVKAFVAKARSGKRKPGKIVRFTPGVGEVTAEVVLSEIGDVSRFRNAKAICAYAGLVPRVRQSGGKKSPDLPITKQGSGLLHWALVEAAWRLVRTSPQWSAFFGRLRETTRAASGPSWRWPEAAVRALRDAQDVHPVQDHRHRPQAAQARQADSPALGAEVAWGGRRSRGDRGPRRPEETGAGIGCEANGNHVMGQLDPGKDRRPGVDRTQASL